MRVVQFGAGRIGKIHARNIASHPRSTLYGIVDPVEEAGKALAEQYDTKFMEETDALGDPQVDAVVIASATNVHADQIELRNCDRCSSGDPEVSILPRVLQEC